MASDSLDWTPVIGLLAHSICLPTSKVQHSVHGLAPFSKAQSRSKGRREEKEELTLTPSLSPWYPLPKSEGNKRKGAVGEVRINLLLENGNVTLPLLLFRNTF